MIRIRGSIYILVVITSVLFLTTGCPSLERVPSLDIPNMKVEEDQVLQFNLIQYTSDKDKETLVFTIVSGVGELDGSTYKYKPENTEGTESVTLRVTNSEGKYAEDTFEIAIEIDIEEILYNNLKETPFITGGLISNQFVRQIHPEMIIYLKTSTTRYAYLQIKSCLDDLEFKYRVFDEDGSISATGIRHLIIDEEYDLDGDDVPELAWLTSNRYIVQTVEFLRCSQMKILKQGI